MTRGLVSVLLWVVFTATSSSYAASPAAASPLSSAPERSSCTGSGASTCVTSAEGGFVGTGERRSQPAPGAAPRPRAPRTPATRAVDDGTRVETLLVPTCSNNAPGRADELCALAVTSCPQPEQVRYWVFRRTVTTAAPDPPYQRVGEPVCIAPAEPGAPPFDPVAAVAAAIEREFQDRAALRGEAIVQPSPRTLVNVPTRLRTSAPERYPIEFVLFGLPVTIEVQAQRWTWITGDGATIATTRRGTGGLVEHSYRRDGQFAPRVDITWSGTWSVPGMTPQPVPGTVTTQGQPGSVQVVEARTELVDR